jgi:hypothetical protein
VTAIDLRISHKNEFYFLEKWRGAPTGYKYKMRKLYRKNNQRTRKGCQITIMDLANQCEESSSSSLS